MRTSTVFVFLLLLEVGSCAVGVAAAGIQGNPGSSAAEQQSLFLRKGGERTSDKNKQENDELDAEVTEFLLRRYLDGYSSMPPKNGDLDDDEIKRTPSVSKQPTWPHEKSDISLNSDVILGELENGMRYQLLSNKVPPGQLEVRLHVDAGANMEKDDELGIAHFLEHMAFQTLRHFPQGSINPIFQRLGLGAGSHVNAYTNFEETVYRLGLPNLDNETVATAFTWSRDVADGIVFKQDELDIERGVVLSEMQDKDSVGERLWEQTLAWLIPDHLRSTRDVIGTKKTITSITKKQLDAFYQTYYVPRRAVLTLVCSSVGRNCL